MDIPKFNLCCPSLRFKRLLKPIQQHVTYHFPQRKQILHKTVTLHQKLPQPHSFTGAPLYQEYHQPHKTSSTSETVVHQCLLPHASTKSHFQGTGHCCWEPQLIQNHYDNFPGTICGTIEYGFGWDQLPHLMSILPQQHHECDCYGEWYQNPNQDLTIKS